MANPDRNLEALNRLREVFKQAPAHRVHMNIIKEKTTCGTAACLIGWGFMDKKLRRMGLVPRPAGWFSNGSIIDNACDVFGIDGDTARNLFAFNQSPSVRRAFDNDKVHAIRKWQVMESLDDVIAGRKIGPYTVRKRG